MMTDQRIEGFPNTCVYTYASPLHVEWQSSFIMKVPVLELLTIIIQGLNEALLIPFKMNTKYSQ